MGIFWNRVLVHTRLNFEVIKIDICQWRCLDFELQFELFQSSFHYNFILMQLKKGEIKLLTIRKRNKLFN